MTGGKTGDARGSGRLRNLHGNCDSCRSWLVGWLDSVRSLLLTVVLWVSPTLCCFIDLFMPWPLDNASPHTSLTK